jgi:branched-subunit amino acid ABC-type transport system permease component
VYTIELLDVVTTAGVLYIVALGLLIVYGVLKIINLAHGAFLALGSYAAVIATWLGWNPWSALVIALQLASRLEQWPSGACSEAFMCGRSTRSWRLGV